MIDEATFRRQSDLSLDALKQSLIAAEESNASSGTFEFEDNNGVMNIIFEDGSSKFVVTPNTPVRQVWISALSTSFKLEFDETTSTFILPKSGEDLKTLTQRLLREHLEDPTITLP
jgi:iron donor protein CyaY